MKVKVAKAPPYIRLFDYKCFGWTGDSTCNRFFLERQQDYANEKLKFNGHLFFERGPRYGWSAQNKSWDKF